METSRTCVKVHLCENEHMKTILVVDDNAELRECLCNLFEGMGWSVLEAINGQDALRVFDENKTIDAVLTDIDMPVKNGLELLRDLRLIAPTMPIYLMSGGCQYTEDELLSFGATKFFEKPFTEISLVTDKIAS